MFRGLGKSRDATATLLAGLRAPLRIEAFISRGRPHLEAVRLVEVLASYESLAPGHVNVIVTHANSDAAIARARTLGFDDIEFYEEHDGKPILSGVNGLAVDYGSSKAIVPQLDSSAFTGLRYWINMKIRELRAKEEKRTVRIGYVPGAVSLDAPELSAAAPQATVRSILARAFPFYSLEAVDLSTPGPIDPALRGLIVLQPARPFTTDERRRIDDYLLLGNRKIAVFASPAIGLLHSPRADPAAYAVDDLTAPYGIHVEADVVIEPAAHLQLELPGEPPRSFEVGAVPIVDETRGSWLDWRFPAFFRISSLALPYASSISIREPGDPSFRIRALARSTAAARSIALADFPPPDRPAEVEMSVKPAGVRVLAAVAAGNLPSAFQPPGDVTCSRRASSPVAVLVVASALLPINAFLYAGRRVTTDRDTYLAAATAFAGEHLTTSILLMKDTLDWLDASPEAEECAYRED